MPTKRKGASKHRHSRRRRSVRGAGKLSNIFNKFTSNKSNKSSLSGITKLEPSHSKTHVENMRFKFIGYQIPPRTDLLLYTGNIRMEKGKMHYMPGGFVLWRGDDEARKPKGWYYVTKFDSDNMPLGLATRVENPDNGKIMMDDKDNIIDERFDYGRYDVVPGPGHTLLY